MAQTSNAKSPAPLPNPIHPVLFPSQMLPILIVVTLSLASAGMMFLERTGLRTTLTLSFKGDVKRESRFVAQYGQLVCTFITALLIWQIDKAHGFRICECSGRP